MASRWTRSSTTQPPSTRLAAMARRELLHGTAADLAYGDDGEEMLLLDVHLLSALIPPPISSLSPPLTTTIPCLRIPLHHWISRTRTSWRGFPSQSSKIWCVLHHVRSLYRGRSPGGAGPAKEPGRAPSCVFHQDRLHQLWFKSSTLWIGGCRRWWPKSTSRLVLSSNIIFPFYSSAP
jgi:hypothetical protein